MNGKIVVPLDGSMPAERAVPLAVSIGARADLPVRLVHVHFPRPELWSTEIEAESYRWEFETREEADAYLAAARSRIAEALRERVSAGVRDGDVASELVEEMGGGEAALVVMTTHGQTGLRDRLLGSVAQKVIHDARIPVILVGPRVGGWPRAAAVRIENIVVGLDGSPSADAVLPMVTRLAGWYQAKVHLVGVVPGGVGFGYPSVPHGAILEGGAVAEALAAHLAMKVQEVRAEGVPASHRVLRDDNVSEGLLQAADDLSADMIAMATHARGPALSVLLGSVAMGVLKKSPVPVLMLRPAKSD